jgi:hypothetical protein
MTYPGHGTNLSSSTGNKRIAAEEEEEEGIAAAAAGIVAAAATAAAAAAEMLAAAMAMNITNGLNNSHCRTFHTLSSSWDILSDSGAYSCVKIRPWRMR